MRAGAFRLDPVGDASASPGEGWRDGRTDPDVERGSAGRTARTAGAHSAGYVAGTRSLPGTASDEYAAAAGGARADGAFSGPDGRDAARQRGLAGSRTGTDRTCGDPDRGRDRVAGGTGGYALSGAQSDDRDCAGFFARQFVAAADPLGASGDQLCGGGVYLLAGRERASQVRWGSGAAV